MKHGAELQLAFTVEKMEKEKMRAARRDIKKLKALQSHVEENIQDLKAEIAMYGEVVSCLKFRGNYMFAVLPISHGNLELGRYPRL